MAGAEQHNIPQSLLRGFRVPGGSKRKSKTWLYEKGVPPRKALIKREVAVERYFYSEPSCDGSKTLDDAITDYEDPFAKQLDKLRAASFGTTVNPAIAAEFVTHLTIRNAHMRRTFTESTKAILNRALDTFASELGMRSLLGADREQPSHGVRNAVDDLVKQNPALTQGGLPPAVLYQMAQMYLRENFATVFATQVPLIMAALDLMASQAPTVIRDGHNKVLESGLAPDPRTEKLRALHWRVEPSPREGAVLPDCIALAIDDASGLKPLIMADLDKIVAVVVPLETERVLVGTRTPTEQLDICHFNEAATACSHTFFIAAREDDALAVLANRIGEYGRQFIGTTIETTFADVMKARATPVETAPAAEQSIAVTSDPPVNAASEAQQPPQYQIHFLGCADQPTAEMIAAALSAVTRAIVQIMPLDRLDGITFAADYPAALRDLDRGFPASEPLKPTTEDFGVGIAMAPLVLRGGVAKTHIVMRGDIAHALISENEEFSRPALHTLVGMLAYAACAQILDEALPGVLLKRRDDPYEGFLYSAIHSAWTGYFSHRAAAAFCPEAGSGQQELLVSALKRAQVEIPAARLVYRYHGDIDRLLRTVLPYIADVLRFAGKVTGHYDGLQQSFLEDRALADSLAQSGLRDWLLLFDGDLSKLWERRSHWASFAEFLALNRHVERLLWLYGIFLSRIDDGRIRVDIPLATDAAKLSGFA